MNNKTLIALLFLSLPLVTWAETNANPDEVQNAKVEQRVERLAKKLSLTDEQKAKVKTILETQRDKIKAVREETHNSLQAVLTPEQMKQYDEMREQRKQRMKEHLQERLKNRQQKTNP